MTQSWLFDVDGTLTPSRQPMVGPFHDWFLNFARNNEVHLVTGSDNPKTLEQVGPAIMAAVRTCFNCMGNSVWRNGQEVLRQDFVLPPEAEAFLQAWLKTSPYPHRCGQHIEVRPGMVNFSVVGRGASQDKRTDYFHWDQIHQERVALAKAFEAQFPAISCQIAGETGVDIFWVGRDKSQVLNDPLVSKPACFFGDRVHPGGNDFSLTTAVDALGGGSRGHSVQGWEDTWRQLQQYHAEGRIKLS